METLAKNLDHFKNVCGERDALLEGSHTRIMYMMMIDKDGVEAQTSVLVQSPDPEAYVCYLRDLIK